MVVEKIQIKPPALAPQEEEQLSVISAKSETGSQTAFDDAANNVLGVGDAGIGDIGIFGRLVGTNRATKTDTLPYCVTITVSPLRRGDFSKTVVMDFGSGCCSHGYLRSGKITNVYTGRLTEAGKSATTTFDNFGLIPCL